MDTADEENMDSSISAIARREFDRPEFQMWNVATPIVIKDFSLKKEEQKKGCCGDPVDQAEGLQ